jgi:chromosome partitioning protein
LRNICPSPLIDTDSQGSLSHWWNARTASEPLFVKVGPFELGKALEHLARSGVKLAVIDTPPAITESIANVIGYAACAHHRRSGCGVVAAWNGGPHHTIHHRVDFAASMVDGRTVGEVTPESASAKEIQQLWNYVQGRLARLKHDAAFAPAERQNFALSGLSPADASEPTEAGDSAGPMDKPVPPERPTPESFTGVERQSSLDRRRVTAEAPRGFDNRRIVKPFGRANQKRTEASFRESRP